MVREDSKSVDSNRRVFQKRILQSSSYDYLRDDIKSDKNIPELERRRKLHGSQDSSVDSVELLLKNSLASSSSSIVHSSPRSLSGSAEDHVRLPNRHFDSVALRYYHHLYDLKMKGSKIPPPLYNVAPKMVALNCTNKMVEPNLSSSNTEAKTLKSILKKDRKSNKNELNEFVKEIRFRNYGIHKNWNNLERLHEKLSEYNYLLKRMKNCTHLLSKSLQDIDDRPVTNYENINKS